MVNTHPQTPHDSNTPAGATLLDRVHFPSDIKGFSDAELTVLCADLRGFMIDTVSKTGGHLGSSLGVVEITVALHAVFDAPDDKIIWDVGHQAYPHKILTGRKDKMHTLRQGGGLSGFTKRSESVYDPFGTAHSSTSISAGLGMATARDLARVGHDEAAKNHVIAVIGDGALSAGMAYEAMNNAGAQTIDGKRTNLIVILNDNEMSIAPPVGAMSRYLTRAVSSKPYITAREIGKKITEIFPDALKNVAKRAEHSARGALGSGTIFEDMGFYYIGPVDGHNLEQLLAILRNLRDGDHEGPILIHAITQKGKGYDPAENSADKMHGVKSFDVQTGAQAKSQSNATSYTKLFSDQLVAEAEKDDKIVAITAAMPSGTGLDAFAKSFPTRHFDVGIAEQHAVTFAAGLATEGYKPFAAIYSTFLQRGYDQIVHDVAIQNLPVRFAIDRAGLVGADGQTHAGAFDIAYLSCLPHMVVMAAADGAELRHMTATAAAYDDGPIAFRYPRGDAPADDMMEETRVLEIGKGRIVQQGTKLALLSFGARLQECQKAAAEIKAQCGVDVTIADARFAKPLDGALIKTLAQEHEAIITIEEGSRGGFGAAVLEHMAQKGLLDHGIKMRTLTLPDIFQDQDNADAQYDAAGLTAAHITTCATGLLS